MKKFIFIFIFSILNANEILISAKEAIELIDKENALFVSSDTNDERIKNSINLNLQNKKSCGLLFECINDASTFIGSHGIDNNTLVIAYGKNAPLVYLYFQSYGHKYLKVLDSSLAQIKKLDPNQKIYDLLILEQNYNMLKDVAKNIYITKEPQKRRHKKIYNIKEDDLNFSNLASKKDVKNGMLDILDNKQSSKFAIIDARSFEEIIGDMQYANVARAGHIPGSVFIQNLKSDDNLTSLRELGITKDKTIYVYEHNTTDKSANIIYKLMQLGFENVKIYTGGWLEWGNDLHLPINK